MSPRALALLVAAVALTACSSAAEEPEGLSDSTTATGSAAASPDETEPAPTSTAGGDEPAEPSPTFTQPYLPDDAQSVIDLPAELPIEPPDGATEEELAVLTAAGRFMASWDAILFGAGDEQSGILETAADPQLGRLVNYAVESIGQQRVIVGEPTVIELRSVSVDGDTAEVDICTIMRDWVQYAGGTPEPQPDVERLVLTMSRQGDEWRASDTEQSDPAPCE